MYGVLTTTVVYSVVRWRRVAVRFTRHRASKTRYITLYRMVYGYTDRYGFILHGTGGGCWNTAYYCLDQNRTVLAWSRRGTRTFVVTLRWHAVYGIKRVHS